MARIDEAAARQELEKAEACKEQAEQLLHIAAALRREAEHHIHEAHQLRGLPRRPQ